MTRSFQMDAEQIETVVRHFTEQASVVEAITSRLGSRLADLRASGWEGEPFYTRMDGEVLPQLGKLSEGLAAAGKSLSDLSAQLKQIQPALDQIQQSMPQIQAATIKLQEQLKKLQNSDEMSRLIQKAMEEQKHDDAQ